MAEDFQLKINLLYIMIILKSYYIGYKFVTYPLEVVFDNVEGQKLSFEEKSLMQLLSIIK